MESNFAISLVFQLPPYELELKISTLYAFSRDWRRLHVFATSSDWLIALSLYAVIGQSSYFNFGFIFKTALVNIFSTCH